MIKAEVAIPQRIAMRKNGTLSYIFGDHLGSTSLITDESGNLVSETKYKACPLAIKRLGMLREGEIRYSSGANPTDYTFTGQFSYADDFGLMFYNARWYDPSLGRFAQADTIVPSGVQGLDRYAYTNNSPLMYTDPSGHAVCDEDGACYNRNRKYQSQFSFVRQRQNPIEAEERIMSLLGFDSFMEYNQWAQNHSDLNGILLNAEPGGIVRFSYTNEGGSTSYFNWMVVEYEDGYAFYNPISRCLAPDSGSSGFTDFVSGAALYEQNNEGDYIPEMSTPGFDTSLPMILPENWNQPGDGGVITWATTNPWQSLSAWAFGIASALPPYNFITPLIGIGAYASFRTLDVTPVYKHHPYGP